MTKKALQRMVAAIFLLHFILTAATATSPSPTAAATATKTFYVNGGGSVSHHQAPANQGPIVNFSSMRRAPQGNPNPSHS
uniref:Uncharacterized protein n=1 Tax=Leersia perrieri TaxID=77586 RepID=A0A0D9XWH4_9ORYZ